MGTVIIRVGLDSLQKPAEHKAPCCQHLTDGNKHCEHPNFVLSWQLPSAQGSTRITTSRIIPKAPEQRCALDLLVRQLHTQQLRQRQTCQRCGSEIPELSVSPCHAVGAEALETAELHERGAGPGTATSASPQGGWPKGSPVPMWLGCLPYSRCTTRPCSRVLCTEPHRLVHSRLLVICTR